jgi:hypothetical protein
MSWTNQPAALAELDGSTYYRTKQDMTNALQARLIVNVAVAGAATPAKLRVQYSIDQTTWRYLDGTAGPSVNINSPTGLKVSSWASLEPGAKADVFLRVVGLDGDDTADPQFGLALVQFK